VRLWRGSNSVPWSGDHSKTSLMVMQVQSTLFVPASVWSASHNVISFLRKFFWQYNNSIAARVAAEIFGGVFTCILRVIRQRLPPETDEGDSRDRWGCHKFLPLPRCSLVKCAPQLGNGLPQEVTCENLGVACTSMPYTMSIGQACRAHQPSPCRRGAAWLRPRSEHWEA
jgi:hypothetical protein